MTSSFSARITVDAGDKTKAIFDSIGIDNTVKTSIQMGDDDDDDAILIRVESENLAHLRANLNSTLRLIRACHDSIESVKI